MSAYVYATTAERRYVEAILRNAIARGYTVSVRDGCGGEGEWTLKRSTHVGAILAALATTGEDTLRFRKGDRKVGDCALIWDNLDADRAAEVVNDYHDNSEMDTIIEGAGAYLPGGASYHGEA